MQPGQLHSILNFQFLKYFPQQHSILLRFLQEFYTRATTYFGVKGLEKVSIPSVAVLVFVGLYAIYLNVEQAGGFSTFQALSAELAAKNPLTTVEAINLVIGSWIVGAVVMPEYTRFR